MDSEDDMIYEDDEESHEEDSNEEDEDFVDIAMEPEPSTTNESKDHEDFPYEVLTADRIVHVMVECIKEVNAVVQIPSTITRILLNHFKWDKEKLMESQVNYWQVYIEKERYIDTVEYLGNFTSALNDWQVSSTRNLMMVCRFLAHLTTKWSWYYDGDQDSLFSEAHVVSPYRKDGSRQTKRTTRGSAAATSEIMCEICCFAKPANEMAGLECGHKFCGMCWTDYLTSKIVDEGMGQTIACAAYGCDILVDDVTVMNFIKDPKVRLKYQHLITNSFVECNKLLRWCPAPDCGHVVKVQHFDVKPVQCACGHTFCFACGENWHDPVKCVWLRKWIKKCDDDSETSNWIAANTKECPRCHVTIEKDGGCNHMICKNQNCKADFCWVCLGPWEPHGSSWYNCNRFDEDEAKKARDSQEKSRCNLQRYLFYCNRYMNHMQSLKFENKLYASVRLKMEEMQQHSMSWIEVQFLKVAVDVLCSCRQTLMYTYVFAFYLQKNNQSIIFEENQKDLEHATEQLSEYLERDITSELLVDIKQKVQDKYRYCESRRKVLLDHVHEGYEKEQWEYQEKVL